VTGARAAFCAIAFACALASSLCPSARAGEWLGSIEAGYESYSERYSISDDDTLASVDEFRTRARLAYTTGLLGRNYALFETRAMLGESSWDATARAFVTRRFASARHAASIDAEVSRRGFREGSTYEFPNDYTHATVRAGLRGRARPWLALRIDDRVEIVDYDERTEFDYDYVRNSVSLAGDAARDPTRGVLAGARVTTFSVPDSAEIEYTALTPFVEVRTFGDAHEHAQVNASVERRRYPDDGTRSSFWAFVVSIDLEFALDARWSVELMDDMEDYAYDEESGAYRDYVENTAAVLVNLHTASMEIGLGPAFGWLNAESSPDDEYRELGARLTLEWFGDGGWWVSASYEPGMRDYPAFKDDAPADDINVVFSDYVYHRVGFFANARAWRSLWLNVFLDYQPEDHEREDDDATATIASLGLVWNF
jgi:hypothetical protein